MLNTKTNHGLGWMGTGHSACNYGLPRKGMCFVEWTYKRMVTLEDGTRFQDTCDRWKRMTLKRARKEKRKIIMCQVEGCKHHAEVLSHYWPNEGDTICMKHYQ